MRRKRTRSSLTSSSSSSATSSSSPSSPSSSEPSSPSSTASSSSADDKPLINGLKRNTRQIEKRSSSKPPRKKLKTMNLNSNGKFTSRTQKSPADKIKNKHQTARNKMKAQPSEAKSENTNPKNAKNDAKLKDNSSSKSVSSKSSSVARQSSFASDAVSRARRVHFGGKSEGRSSSKKTDPEVIFKLFDKPSRIYQLLAARQSDSPFILRRNLSYMAKKGKGNTQIKRKNDRFKLPPCLTEKNDHLQPSFSSKKGSTRLSTSQSDALKSQLHLVIYRVVGMIPGQLRTTSSMSSRSQKKRLSSAVGSNERFVVDVVVSQNYRGKKQDETKINVIASDLEVEFIKEHTASKGVDDFLGTNTLFYESGHLLQTAVISSSLLYPPNGYTQGCASIRIRATSKPTGWAYYNELTVSYDRNPPVIINGFYTLNLNPLNGAQNFEESSPKILFGLYWAPSDVTLSGYQVFANIQKEISVKVNKVAPAIFEAAVTSDSIPADPQEVHSATSSPTRSINSRSRILRVVFWLSDPSAGGSGICASVANPFRCPWCHTICPHFLSLLRHLRCWHPRFSFVLQAERVARVADILVTINRRYDCAEENRYPPTLVASVPLVGVQKPVKRLSSSQIIWFSGKSKNRRINFHKASSTALAEFRRPESDLNPLAVNVTMASGHLRMYYHSQTCLPMTPDDLLKDCDSDTEEQQWLAEQSWRLLNEFTDVNAGEKSMMNMWNRFMYRERFFSQRSMFPACLAFVEEFGPEIMANKLLGNFRLHLTCLFQNNLLTPPQFFAVMARLQEKLDRNSAKGEAINGPSH